MKHMKQLKYVLAGIVALTTVFALIRPAITLETICGKEEHTHSQSCYKVTQETIVDQSIDCSYDSLHVHVHSPSCYNQDNELICGYADYLIHEHNEDCYNENNELICPLPEIKEHSHDSSCYDSENHLICGQQEIVEHKHNSSCYDQEGNLICDYPELEKHDHDENCITKTERILEDKELICTKEEHVHTEECYPDETEYVCGKEEHVHDESCYDSENNLICEKEEHTHTDDCLTNKEEIDDEIENEPIPFSLDNRVSTYANNIYVEKGNVIWYTDCGFQDSNYDDYGTTLFTITINGIVYDSYCVEPLRKSPTEGTNNDYNNIIPIGSNDLLTKVYYYGTNASGNKNFYTNKGYNLTEKQKYVINHIALSYVYWDYLEDSVKSQYSYNRNLYAYYAINSTGQNYAQQLINYAQSQPSMPSAIIKMNNSNNVTLQAYLNGNTQRTQVVNYTSDNQQIVTFSLPEGVKFHKITSSGEEVINSGNVTLSGNVQFYFSASLNQTENFTRTLQGIYTKDYSVYTIKTKDRTVSGNKSQDLAILYSTTEGTSVQFTVKWVNANIDIEKRQNKDNSTISGVEFLHTFSDDKTETLTTNDQGIIHLENLSSGTHKIKETEVMDGYQLNENEFTFTVNSDGSINMSDLENKNASYENNKLIIKDDVNDYGLNIIKTNGDSNYKLKGAEFTLYNDSECHNVLQTVTTDENGSLIFAGLKDRQTYYFKETKAPPGYSIPLDDNNNVPVYSLKVELNPNKNLIKVYINNIETTSFKFNEQFENPIISIEISNIAIEYELPETGGPGDWLYIGSGIGLITLAGYFLIKRRIHGKEDLISQ